MKIMTVMIIPMRRVCVDRGNMRLVLDHWAGSS